MPTPPDQQAELDRLRAAIDEVDRALAGRLDERARLVAQIAAVKSQSGKAVYDPAREASVVARALDWLTQQKQASIPAASLRRIMQVLMQESRAWQSGSTVAYLGPAGTYSHQAAIEAFGAAARAAPEADFDQVFRAVLEGRAAYGVLPVENSIEGPIGRTLDLLARNDVQIVGEVTLPVQNVLLAVSETLDLREVTHVYSHPQPLGQCRRWLRENMPQAQQVATASTVSEIAELLNHDNPPKSKWAVIAGRHAADVFGLKVVATDISDAPTNSTMFVVVRLRDAAIAGESAPFGGGAAERLKTSLILTLPHRAGSLYHALEPVATSGANMLRIQSRPIADHPWEYVFFVDVEGSVETPAIGKMVEELRTRAASVKMLGSYPVLDLSRKRA